jgi:hypothetical protein
LWNAAEKGADITFAIPALVKALGDNHPDVRNNASWSLENTASKDYINRVTITKAFMDFMNSHEFMLETEKNSDRFIETIKTIDKLARKIDELERKAA